MHTKLTMRLGILIIAMMPLSLLAGCLFDIGPGPLPPPPSGWGYLSITGFAYDVHHNPIQGATISIFQDGQVRKSALSGPDGRYSISKALVLLNYRLQVKATCDTYVDYMSEIYETTISSSGLTLPCNVWLRKSNETIVLTYSGYVRDSRGNPISDAQVKVHFLTAAGSSSSVETITDSQGSYLLENFLPRSNWGIVFVVSKPGYNTFVSPSYNEFFDAVKTLDFTLFHDVIIANVSGRVVDEYNSGISASISISGYAKTPFTIIIQTNSIGEYSAQGFSIEKDTPLQIIASRQGYVDALESVFVDTSRTYYLDDLVLIPVQ